MPRLIKRRFAGVRLRRQAPHLTFAKLWAEMVRPWSAWPVHPDQPRRVNLGPIFSRPSLINDAVQDGVDDVGSS